MPRKRKQSDLSERCRFCLARQDAAFATQLFADGIKPKFEDLERCANVQIVDKPNYPKNICYVCFYKLEMWSDFKSQFLKTHKTIVTHFKVVDNQASDEEKVANAVNAADDLSPDNNKKRQKIEVTEPELQTPLELPVTPQPATATIEDIVLTSDATQNEDKNKDIASKTQPSDNSITSGRKSSRSKKIEREASTKRWVERKNALIAATGEISSDSESDNPAQLSPVQKARAKSNNDLDQVERQRKMDKALKNLETNMTEKYKVSQDLITDGRKTRSRLTSFINEQKIKEGPKVVLSKSAEAERKVIQESPKKDLKKEKDKEVKPEPKKDISDRPKPTLLNLDCQPMIVPEAERHPSDIKDSDDVEIIEVENAAIAVQESSPKKNNAVIMPQLVTSEVSVGNATYIVTTTLDVPEALTTKNDISLKTNGINVDSASQDGKKLDLLNAVELQRVKPSPTKINTPDSTKSDLRKCLKIEVEGTEVEALQRVQLELAHFVKEDIRKRILEKPAEKKVDTSPTKFKDSYESLDHQLKTIIEKVLRSNFEAEKLDPSMLSNHQKISQDFIKAAMNSPVFQPQVMMHRLNMAQLCKKYNINNLHILEDEKRRKGLVGPLSRTLTKRSHRLPKKFEDFSLEEDLRKVEKKKAPVWFKVPESAPRPNIFDVSTVSKAVTNDILHTAVDEVTSTLSIPTAPSTKTIPIANEKPVALATTLANKPSTVTIVKTVNTGNAMTIKQTLSRPANATVKSPPPMIMPTSSAQASLSTPNKSPAIIVNKSLSKPITVNNAPAPKTPASKTLAPKTPAPKTPAPKTTAPKTTAPKTPASKTPALKAPALKAPVPKTPAPKTPPKRHRHICGICGKELFSKEEAEAHVKNHKVEAMTATPPPASSPPQEQQPQSIKTPSSLPNSATLNTSEPQKPKAKLMRCKRCQAIVEARHVKTHVCNSVKYNCRLCDCSFGAENLLVVHLETHTQNKAKDKSKDGAVKRKETLNNSKVSEPEPEVNEEEEDNGDELERLLKEKEPQGYSCFVCDKVFVDEEQMKDHLQMHCEEVSENEKGFQCAFCGDKFQTEESLEEHVGQHLLEDGDEKINMLINMDTKRDRQKKAALFKCEQCNESFTSSLMLAMHLPLHEEEEAAAMLAEQEEGVVEEEIEEDEGVDEQHHVCTVCDEIFETSEELAEHVDVHNGNAHVCILCEKPFSSIRDLQEHVSTHL